ncbi:MAG TPA: DUF3261 domain-containing protein [Myxococcota bacterium]|nr:DUF3261 domain-containing protein [Myxococcota bacterium]
MRRTVAGALACAALASCRTLAPQLPPALVPLPRLADCPGPLRSTDDLEGDWVVHERIRVVGERVDESFGLVLEKSGPKLVLVGLTPFGAKAFGVTQIGVQTWSQSFLGPALAVPPENVLRDVHRAHFLASDEAELDARQVTRDADGVVHIAAQSCGYHSTLAPISAVAPQSAP